MYGASSAAGDQAGIQQQYDISFSQCMYSRGELVPGYAPVVASGGAAPDPTVRASQVELNRLGYLHDAADGYAGSHTRAAISSFQQSNGLPVDGVASSRLLARLQSTPTSASASAAPSGWVAPTGGSQPAATPAAAPAAWVSPTQASATAPTAAAAPAGWVAPTKSP
jgi:peptidoglycan hydrolase-like protein with peptidoglycan-binding domain